LLPLVQMIRSSFAPNVVTQASRDARISMLALRVNLYPRNGQTTAIFGV
jgi:hypothetical protein